jgi:peptidoglycan/LPS O-acetylase OafA/YrhL
MGILRTILALAVVVYHSYKFFGLRMCGGQVAVETFYIISGFYMALILNEKYVGVGSYKKFILSRFYRIFPVYWIILILALLLSLVGYFGFNQPYYLSRYTHNNSCLSGLTILYFVFENIVVIGQDILYFLKLDESCAPIFTHHVLSFKHAGYQYLLVPQAWSISIEFMFYLMAPFLVTKKVKYQLALVLLGLSLKYYFFNYEYLRYDPWTYRFFPFELAFFMAGSLAYAFYKYIEKKSIPSYIGYYLMCSLIVLVFFYELITIKDQLKNSLFYLLVLGSIPFIFLSFKDNKLDRYIGELSFSLYISHHLMVSVFRGYFFSNPHNMYLYGYTVVFSSLIIAFLLQKTIIKYIESYRIKLFS